MASLEIAKDKEVKLLVPSLQFCSSLCIRLCHFFSSSYYFLFHLLSLHPDPPPLFPPVIRYLLPLDIFLSQVGINVFPLLNLFPAYVLFCQLFRDLVNICTERPAGNQPVGVSSLCQLKQCVCVCVRMGNHERLHFNVCKVCVCVCVCVCVAVYRSELLAEGQG